MNIEYKIAKDLFKEYFSNEDNFYLYHATYKPLLNSIKKNGLGNTKRTNWEDSKRGVVYLASDKDVAESYAESAENINEEWLDEIIILKVNVKDLDKNKLKIDENVLLDEDEVPETFEYHGIIPFSKLNIEHWLYYYNNIIENKEKMINN